MDELPERQPSRDIASLKQMLGFLRPYMPQLTAAAIALVVTASVTLSVGQGLRLLIDEALATSTPDVLRLSIGVFAALILVLAAGTYVRYYFVSWIGERVSADIRQAVYANLVRMHPGYFETNRPTEIMSRITTDTTLLQTVLGSSASVALRNALMLTGGIVMLFVTNPKLSLVVLVSAPIVVSPIVLFGRRVRRLSRTSQTAIADVGSYAGESLRHIKVVQAFTHEARDIDAFAGRVASAFDVAVQRIRQRAVLIAAVMVLTPAAVAAMLWVGGNDVIAGRTSAGELTAFIFYALVVAGSATAISEVWTDIQRAAGAAERLLELLSVNSVLAEPESPETPTRPGAVASTTSPCAIPPEAMKLRWTVSIFAWHPEKWSRWWVRRGPERVRSSTLCNGSTIPRKARFRWAASMRADCRRRHCAARWASYRRTPWFSPARSWTTSSMAHRARVTTKSGTRSAPPMPWALSKPWRVASPRNSEKTDRDSPAASGNASRLHAP